MSMDTLSHNRTKVTGINRILCELLFAISEGRAQAAALLASSAARLAERGAAINPKVTAGTYTLTTDECGDPMPERGLRRGLAGAR